MKPNMGKNTDVMPKIPDAAVSVVDTIKFPAPPVVAVDAKRVPAELPFTAAAVPPPAMIAKPHCITSELTSPNDNAMSNVPAIPAKGTAMVSNILSIQGM